MDDIDKRVVTYSADVKEAQTQKMNTYIMDENQRIRKLEDAE